MKFRVGGGGGLQQLSVSLSPLGTNWVLELIGTWLGLGVEGFETGLIIWNHLILIINIQRFFDEEGPRWSGFVYNRGERPQGVRGDAPTTITRF